MSDNFTTMLSPRCRVLKSSNRSLRRRRRQKYVRSCRISSRAQFSFHHRYYFRNTAIIHRQSENGIAYYDHSLICILNLMNFGPQTDHLTAASSLGVASLR